ncbi:MAG: hypothetical protein KGY99_08840 [Phycisphaerae bacterium]|nr:hypothetical protein [Phycisphaerae bacterium]
MPSINLLPDDYYKRRCQKRANTLCLVLFAVVMAGVVAAVLLSERRVARAEQVARDVEQQYQRAAQRIEQMQQLENEKARLDRKAQDTAALVERLPRSTLLALVTNWLPEYASLECFELETEQAKASSAAGRSKFARVSRERSGAAPPEIVTLYITGRAKTDVDVGQFLARLNASRIIRSARFVYSEAKVYNDVPVREFQVEAVLNGNVDAADVVATDAAPAENTVSYAGGQP